MSAGPSLGTAATYRGKYVALWRWLSRQPDDERLVRATFVEIEDLLGFALPPSSRRHLSHWYSKDGGSAVANAIHRAGWRAREVDLGAQRVVFTRLDDSDST